MKFPFFRGRNSNKNSKALKDIKSLMIRNKIKNKILYPFWIIKAFIQTLKIYKDNPNNWDRYIAMKKIEESTKEAQLIEEIIMLRARFLYSITGLKIALLASFNNENHSDEIENARQMCLELIQELEKKGEYVPNELIEIIESFNCDNIEQFEKTNSKLQIAINKLLDNREEPKDDRDNLNSNSKPNDFGKYILITQDNSNPAQYYGETIIANLLLKMGANPKITQNPRAIYELYYLVKDKLLHNGIKSIDKGNTEQVKQILMNLFTISREGAITYEEITQMNMLSYHSRRRFVLDESNNELIINEQDTRTNENDDGKIKRNIVETFRRINEDGIEMQKKRVTATQHLELPTDEKTFNILSQEGVWTNEFKTDGCRTIDIATLNLEHFSTSDNNIMLVDVTKCIGYKNDLNHYDEYKYHALRDKDDIGSINPNHMVADRANNLIANAYIGLNFNHELGNTYPANDIDMQKTIYSLLKYGNTKGNTGYTTRNSMKRILREQGLIYDDVQIL